jgi:hypothetical protein
MIHERLRAFLESLYVLLAYIIALLTGQCELCDASQVFLALVPHILYWCLSHEQELEPKEQLCYSWLLKFLEANESMFAFEFDIP